MTEHYSRIPFIHFKTFFLRLRQITLPANNPNMSHQIWSFNYKLLTQHGIRHLETVTSYRRVANDNGESSHDFNRLLQLPWF